MKNKHSENANPVWIWSPDDYQNLVGLLAQRNTHDKIFTKIQSVFRRLPNCGKVPYLAVVKNS